MSKNGNHKILDELNWSILEELQQNARLTTAEIGRRVGLSAPAVADRIQKMEELEIIQGYQPSLDFNKLGLTIRAFISFKAIGLKHAELMSLIQSVPEVVEWHTVTGNYSVLLKVAAYSGEHLAAVIEKLEEFGETNTSLILSQSTGSIIIKRPG
jgi:Lrp/AsnC family transcriptional regulator, leucine-responsive regulatory protein